MVLFGLAVLGRGVVLAPAYSVDDYVFVHFDHIPWRKFAGEGRFGLAALVAGLEYLGVGPQWSWMLFGLVHLLFWPLLALAVVRWWGCNLRRADGLLAAAIISCHPFATEFFSLRTAQVLPVASFGLAGLVLFLRRRVGWHLAASALLLGIALSIMQSVLHLVVMIALTGWAVALSREASIQDRGAGARLEGAWPGDVLGLHGRSWRLLIATGFGVVLYSLVSVGLKALLDVNYESRMSLLDLSDLGTRLREGMSAVFWRTLHPGPVTPWGASILQGLILASTSLLLVVRAATTRVRRAKLLYCLALFLLMAASTWTLGLMWVLRDFFPTPRVTFHVAVFWAAVIIVGYRASGRRWMRVALAGASAILVVSYLGTSNRVLTDQRRLNLRDHSRTTRIVADLETAKGVENARRLAVVGGGWTYPAYIQTLDGLLNTSGFGSWARVEMFVEVSGMAFKRPSVEEEEWAALECKRRRPWPADGGAFVEGELAVVCLELSGGQAR